MVAEQQIRQRPSHLCVADGVQAVKLNEGSHLLPVTLDAETMGIPRANISSG